MEEGGGECGSVMESEGWWMRVEEGGEGRRRVEENHLKLGVHSDALPPPPLSEGHLQDLPDQLHHGRLGLEHEDPGAGHQELG